MTDFDEARMYNQFVPYDIAIELKNIGFNEPCFAYYNSVDKQLGYCYPHAWHTNKEEKRFPTAPLYQQVFHWFKELGYECEGHTFDDFYIKAILEKYKIDKAATLDCDIILIPNNEVRNINIAKCIKQHNHTKVGEFKIIINPFVDIKYWQSHHMYFKSKRPIEKGDWVLHYMGKEHPAGNYVFKCTENDLSDIKNGIHGISKGDNTNHLRQYCFKIEASTDFSLNKKGAGAFNSKACLPVIKTEFVEMYIGKMVNRNKVKIAIENDKVLVYDNIFVIIK